jgi:alkanesulfonate monooxygenase SsuD/methylene tetrahydromethanopterin reductase-like flavin-dependent oxidoreductase (luciferase family)
MKLDVAARAPLRDAGREARRLEIAGYDGIWAAETSHDPFLTMTLAAAATETADVGTGIAVAFARNPMTLATLGQDLQVLSEGRFILGLGSQVQAHIDRRFFNPGPSPFGPPRVFLAGVGPKMIEVAGEMADGFLCHGFTTASYLSAAVVPALERGLARSARSRAAIEVTAPGFLVTGRDEEEMARSATAVRRRLAFYGSTPAYRPVLEHHGWGELQTELHQMARRGQWEQMGDLIEPEILEAFAVIGPPRAIAELVAERFGNAVDRMNAYSPFEADDDLWAQVRHGFSSQTLVEQAR